jgi:hypothetical protein
MPNATEETKREEWKKATRSDERLQFILTSFQRHILVFCILFSVVVGSAKHAMVKQRKQKQRFYLFSGRETPGRSYARLAISGKYFPGRRYLSVPLHLMVRSTIVAVEWTANQMPDVKASLQCGLRLECMLINAHQHRSKYVSETTHARDFGYQYDINKQAFLFCFRTPSDQVLPQACFPCAFAL